MTQVCFDKLLISYTPGQSSMNLTYFVEFQPVRCWLLTASLCSSNEHLFFTFIRTSIGILVLPLQPTPHRGENIALIKARRETTSVYLSESRSRGTKRELMTCFSARIISRRRKSLGIPKNFSNYFCGSATDGIRRYRLSS